MPTVVYQPADASASDTYIKNVSRGTSGFPTAATLALGPGSVGLDGSHSDQRILFDWDISDLPDGIKVTSATLELNKESTPQSAGLPLAGRIYRISDSAVTEAATWSTSNGSDAWASPQLPSGGGGGTLDTSQFVSFSIPDNNLSVSDATLASMVQDAVNNREKKFRMVLGAEIDFTNATPSASAEIKYHSSSGSIVESRPKLTVEYFRHRGSMLRNATVGSRRSRKKKVD
tara:strand:- start:385 stop:1077 length:693 start_codon:yes stop_codon:yes gene_type:complete